MGQFLICARGAKTTIPSIVMKIFSYLLDELNESYTSNDESDCSRSDDLLKKNNGKFASSILARNFTASTEKSNFLKIILKDRDIVY